MPTRADLVKQLAVLRNRQRATIGSDSDEDTFPVWALLTLATRNERLAAEAICGGANDCNNDAIFCDPGSKTIWIVQGKFHQVPNKHSELPAYIKGFAKLATRLFEGPDGSSDPGFWRRIDRNTRGAGPKFREASRRARDEGYHARLVYASLWRFSAATAMAAATRTVEQADRHSTIDFLGWDEIRRLLGNYLRDIAPAVPKLTLHVTQGAPTPESMGSTTLRARTFTTSGRDVARLLEQGGEQVFARNIRLGLGDKVKVNAAIARTIREEPEKFWFLNNGLTLVCSSARAIDSAMEIFDAQIINGQQTTRALHKAQEDGLTANLGTVRVSVRIIQLGDRDPESTDKLVTQIVEATNFQNSISEADLRSNDVEQIELMRELGSRGYRYERKRGQLGNKDADVHLAFLKRKLTPRTLATAVGNAIEESLPLRAGSGPLFDMEQPHYARIFLEHDVDYMLTCYWLWWVTGRRASRSSDRAAARYVVHHDLCRSTLPYLSNGGREFVLACEVRDRNVLDALSDATDALYDVAIAAYHSNYHATGRRAIKPYHQNREVDAYSRFLAKWNEAPGGRSQVRFTDALDRLLAAV